MQKYFAFAFFITIVIFVVIRANMLRIKGVKAFFIEKVDIFILPFVLILLYYITAMTFNLPIPLRDTIINRPLFNINILSWLGVLFCLSSVVGFIFSLKSFGDSFRVGVDKENPDKLITTGVFGVSRNPIYLSFDLLLIGFFMIFANLIFLSMLCLGTLLFHRQVLKEEKFLKEHYGEEYQDYAKKVHRYL